MDMYTTTHYAIEQGGLPNHKNLRSRAAAGIVAGCLALSVCPAIALAAPPEQDAPQGVEVTMQQPMDGQVEDFGNGRPSDEGFSNQGDSFWGEGPAQGGPSGDFTNDQGFNGEMPDEQPSFEQDEAFGMPPENNSGEPAGNQPGEQWGETAFSHDQQAGAPQNGQPMQNQQPGGPMGGQPGTMMAPTSGNMPMDNPMDLQISQFIKEKFGIDLEDGMGNATSDNAQKPGEQSTNGQVPELPEGSVNVQQIIDSVHDLMLKYDIQMLEDADLDDSEFMNELSEYITKANEERLQQFASGEKPGQNGPTDQTSESKQENAPGKADRSTDLAASKGQPDNNSKANEKAGTSADKASSSKKDTQAIKDTASSQANAADKTSTSKDAASDKNASQLSDSFLSKIVNFIAGVFGFKA